MEYNRQGQVIETIDQAGTAHQHEYDKLGRPIHDRVSSLGTNVDGAVRRISKTYEVRGMLEKVTSYDATSGNVVNEAQFAYNDFGQLVTDYQAHSGAVNTSTSPRSSTVTATARPIVRTDDVDLSERPRADLRLRLDREQRRGRAESCGIACG